jgi:hypothetical protein
MSASFALAGSSSLLERIRATASSPRTAWSDGKREVAIGSLAVKSDVGDIGDTADREDISAQPESKAPVKAKASEKMRVVFIGQKYLRLALSAMVKSRCLTAKAQISFWTVPR